METGIGKIGIVGGTGWLGRALGHNLLKRGLAGRDLVVLNRRGPTDDYAMWPAVVWAKDLGDLVAQSDLIVLSVRPEDYHVPAPQAFEGTVISFMAGVLQDELARDWPDAQIARAMPGGGATEGNAHVPWCSAETLPPEALTRVTSVLSAIGTVDQVQDEAALAYLSALSGSGAAYPALMAQAMFRHALSQGIASDIAWRAVASVVCDAPNLFRDGPQRAAELIDTYRGYKGITAAGIDTAQAEGLETAIERALDAATQKAMTFRKA